MCVCVWGGGGGGGGGKGEGGRKSIYEKCLKFCHDVMKVLISR